MREIHLVNIAAFDLNLLKVLDALLREGSTVRAGERIGLSQPAVSAALGRLRLALGDELFVRRGNGLEPTDHARALALPVREVLDAVEGVLAGPEFDPATSDAVFRLSGSDFFAEMLMPALAERLSREAPGMRVHLIDAVHTRNVADMERAGVDMALLPSVEFPDWIDHRPVFRSDFAVVARTGHPRLRDIAPGGTIPLPVYSALGHVLFSSDGAVEAIGDDELRRLGGSRRVAMTLPGFLGMTRAVAASNLIALMPGALCRRIEPGAGLEVYLPPMRTDLLMIEMIWPRRSTSFPAHRWFREVVAELLLPLNEGLPDLPG